ncbi:hypothetical protein ACPSKX_20465 [Moritella viscosa]
MIITQGELGRLQVKILEAQISSLEKAYNQRSQFNEQVWKILNDYKCRESVFKATATSKISAEANSRSLSASADASAELFAGLKVEVTKEWDFANIMQNKVTANALVGSNFKAKINYNAKINNVSYASANAKIDEEKKTTIKSGLSDPMQLIPGIDLGVNAELAAMMGAKVTVTHVLTVGQIMAMTNEAELFVGAEVKASASLRVNSNNIYGKKEIIVGKLGASAFAGLKATGSSSITFKARGINAASVSASASVSAGIGITAEIQASIRTSGDVKFKVSSGATAGIGASTSLGATVNPVALKVILWDGFAHHLTTQKYQRRKNEKLDRNLNTVAITRCNEHAIQSLNSLESDYIKMAEELWRLPVDAIMRSSDVLSKSVADNKSHLKKQSRGRKVIRKIKGLLAVQPPLAA